MNFKYTKILAKTTGYIDHWMKEAPETCIYPNNFTEIRESKQENHGTNQHGPRQGHQTTMRKYPTTIGIPAIPSYARLTVLVDHWTAPTVLTEVHTQITPVSNICIQTMAICVRHIPTH
jgi:hypothetical protein